MAVIPSSAAAFDQMLVGLSQMSKLVGKCRLLSMHLGSSVDSRKLRHDLATLRERMKKTICESRELFITQCREVEGRSDHDQDQFERVYAMFVAAVEYFLCQLMHIATIIKENPKSMELIVTGVTDHAIQFSRSSGFSLNRQLLLRASRHASGANTGNVTPQGDEKEAIDADIQEISEVLNDLHSSVHLRYWDIVPDMAEGTSRMGSRSSLLSSEDDGEGEGDKKKDSKKKRSSKKRKKDGSAHIKSKADDPITTGVSSAALPPHKPLFFTAASDSWYLKHRHDGILAFFGRFLHRRRYYVLGGSLALIALIIIIALSITLTQTNNAESGRQRNETNGT